MTLQVLYLAHDLADAAIRRRVLTLKAGGATVTVAGFTRGRNLLASETEVTSIVLGETADGRFLQRIGAVASARMGLRGKLAGVAKPDVIIARNLETLALAGAAADLFGAETPIVYECLDIHRLLLDDGIKGQMMRAAQRRLGARAKLLITSSPAFVENFFKPLSGLDLPVLLLENKVLALDGERAAMPVAPRPPEPGNPGGSAGSGRSAAPSHLASSSISPPAWRARSRSCYVAGRPIASLPISMRWSRPHRMWNSTGPTAIRRIFRRSTTTCSSPGRSISSRKG